MNEQLERVFDLAHRLDPEIPLEVGPSDLRRLRRLVRGDAGDKGRLRAAEILARARPRGAEDLFGVVLNDPREHPNVRASMPYYLAIVGGPASERILAGALHPRQEITVLRRCLVALPKFGSRLSVDGLEQLIASGPRSVQPQTRFALSVIAARLRDRAAFRLRPSKAWSGQANTSGVQPRIGRLSAKAGARIVATLGPDSYGLSLDSRHGLLFDCLGRQLALLLDERFVGPFLQTVRDGPALVGVLAGKPRVSDRYSASRVILAWPGRDSIYIGLYRSDGEAMEFGRQAAGREQAPITIDSVRPVGPVVVHATVPDRGQLTDTQVTASLTEPRKRNPLLLKGFKLP